MRKFIASAWVFASSLVLMFTLNMGEANAQIHDQPLSLTSVATQLHTPEAVARYLWKNFSFETDQRLFGQTEYWQSPEEFLENGKGDCEDFAQFAVALLKLNGSKAYLLNIYGVKLAHTICVFVEEGKYHAIDGSDLKRPGADSLEELITKTYPNWENAALVAQSQTRPAEGRLLKRIERKPA